MKKEIMCKAEFVNSMDKLSKLRQDEHKRIKDLLKEFESDSQRSVGALPEERKKP